MGEAVHVIAFRVVVSVVILKAVCQEKLALSHPLAPRRIGDGVTANNDGVQKPLPNILVHMRLTKRSVVAPVVDVDGVVSCTRTIVLVLFENDLEMLLRFSAALSFFVPVGKKIRRAPSRHEGQNDGHGNPAHLSTF